MTHLLILVVAALLVIAICDQFAAHTGLAAPLVLLVLGGAVALIPAVPEVEVDPELVLQVILPPLLFSSAFRMPTMEFRRNLGPIATLAFLLVAACAVLLGLVFTALVPEMNLATGIALGAIVSPTDAVATSIVRKAGVSERMVAILEGEGLINDATALVVLGTAVTAAVGTGGNGGLSAGGVALDFIWTVVAAVVVGAVVGWVMMHVRGKIDGVAADTAVTFAMPYLAFVPAEHIGGSGLVAAVVAGLIMGAQSPRLVGPSARRAAAQNWETMVLVLESVIFLLMGLELPTVLHDVTSGDLGIPMAVLIAAVGLLGTVVIRALVVFPLLRLTGKRRRKRSARRPRLEAFQDRLDAAATGEMVSIGRRQLAPTRAQQIQDRLTRMLSDIDYYKEAHLGPRDATVIVWAGMRGAITLAAAQTLPRDVTERPFLVLVAFILAASSLVIQGGTLSWVVRLVKPRPATPPSTKERQELLADMRHAAAMVELPPEVKRAIELRERSRRKTDENMTDAPSPQSLAVGLARRLANPLKDNGYDPDTRLRLAAEAHDYAIAVIEAERTAVLDVRDQGRYSTATLEQAMQILDLDQISLETRAAH